MEAWAKETEVVTRFFVSSFPMSNFSELMWKPVSKFQFQNSKRKNMKKQIKAFAIFFTLTSLSACGGSGGGYSFDDFAGDFSQAFCEKLVECDLTSESVSECVNESNANADANDCPEFDHETAENCVNETANLDCDADDLPVSCHEVCGN